MLRLCSLSRHIYSGLVSAAKKNIQKRVVNPTVRSYSPNKSKVANIFVNQYIRTYSAIKGPVDQSTSQDKQQERIKMELSATSKVQNLETNPAATAEMINYYTLYNLINNIEKNQSAICLGLVAEEAGLVREEKEYTEKELKKLEWVDPSYASIESAIKKAYNSVGFAFDLGKSGLNDDFTLQIQSANGKLVHCGTLRSIWNSALKEHCKPAPYGDLKTASTKVDPEVRSALTIDYDKLVITKKEKKRDQEYSYQRYKEPPKQSDKINVDDNPQEDHYKKTLQNLLSRVQEEFQDDTLYLEPYKLNMYDKGGFFKPHVDTPRYENMVGTLVVRLGDADNCRGGDMIVRHGDETFKAKGAVTAFFCDREHEITPVTMGTRVALTFNICKDNASVTKSDQAITLTRTTPLPTDRNVASLIQAIKESPFKKVGLLTEFDYTQKSISLQSLKGNDRLLLEELSKEPSFKIDLVPTVVSMHYDDNTCHDVCPHQYYRQGSVYRFLTEDLERMMRGEKAPEIKKEDRTRFFRVKDGLEVYKHEQEGAESTGNEALEHIIDNIYFNAAIIVTDLNPKSTPKEEDH